MQWLLFQNNVYIIEHAMTIVSEQCVHSWTCNDYCFRTMCTWSVWTCRGTGLAWRGPWGCRTPSRVTPSSRSLTSRMFVCSIDWLVFTLIRSYQANKPKFLGSPVLASLLCKRLSAFPYMCQLWESTEPDLVLCLVSVIIKPIFYII